MLDQQSAQPAHIRVAAIDLGTNSFHAVIVDIYPDGSYTVVDSLKEMVCLGKRGVGKRLSHEEMQIGLEALKKIKTLCDRQKVEKIIANATSAIREAKNGGDFVQLIIDELQIKIRAIPGTKEAELIGIAIQHGMALDDKPALAMDIGGGSTEFVVLNKKTMFHLESFKIGVSRMAADFVKSDPVKTPDIKLMTEFYKKKLENIIPEIKKYKPKVLIGSSGTMQNIASMVAATKGMYPMITLNEFEYTAEEFNRFYDLFITFNKKNRKRTPGLDEKRIDFIVPGLILVKFVLETFKIKRIKTSTQAMREGIILEYIQNDLKALKLLAKYPETRERSVYELVKKYRWHEAHSRQVARLAVKLFDETASHHNMGKKERELLHFASLMHDIGYHISQKKHHKHSLYIILNSNLKGFTQEEIQVMAHVARYHRRSIPNPKRHLLYGELSFEQQILVRKLSAFLRVADGLDRSHYQNITSLAVDMGDITTISITSLADPELEVWGAMRKRELFEALMGAPLVIKSLNYPNASTSVAQNVENGTTQSSKMVVASQEKL